MRGTTMLFGVLGSLLILSSPAWADDDDSSSDEERTWGDHARPYTFEFGNHIDTHQESRIGKDGALRGFFYVFYDTDERGKKKRTDDGLPIVKHCTKDEHYKDDRCVVGWTFRAKPCIEANDGCRAKFLYHQHDHPVWLVGASVAEDHDGNITLSGSRLDIPQPGGWPGHYHWLSADGSVEDVEDALDIEVDIPDGCDVDMASKLATGAVCPGYFWKIVWDRECVAFHHGGESIPVCRGLDMRTHLNIVTSYVPVPLEDLADDDPEPSGGGGGHH